MLSRFPTARTWLAVALACAAAATHAQSATVQPVKPLSASVYNTARDELTASYRAAREACTRLAGNAKDVCVARAKGDEKVGMAHLAFQRSGKAKDHNDYLSARNEARYEIAKETCDDMAGNPKDVCRADAKSAYEKAKADMKANKAVNEARADAVDTKMKADYQAAAERCDALSGDGKDACVASAKARFQQ